MPYLIIDLRLWYGNDDDDECEYDGDKDNDNDDDDDGDDDDYVDDFYNDDTDYKFI